MQNTIKFTAVIIQKILFQIKSWPFDIRNMYSNNSVHPHRIMGNVIIIPPYCHQRTITREHITCEDVRFGWVRLGLGCTEGYAQCHHHEDLKPLMLILTAVGSYI
jgi:hypothetical protein